MYDCQPEITLNPSPDNKTDMTTPPPEVLRTRDELRKAGFQSVITEEIRRFIQKRVEANLEGFEDIYDNNLLGELQKTQAEDEADNAAELANNDDNDDELSEGQLTAKEQLREQERCRMRMDVKVAAAKHMRSNMHTENNSTIKDKKDEEYLSSNHLIPRSYREKIREENRLDRLEGKKCSKSSNANRHNGAVCNVAY